MRYVGSHRGDGRLRCRLLGHHWEVEHDRLLDHGEPDGGDAIVSASGRRLVPCCWLCSRCSMLRHQRARPARRQPRSRSQRA